jgi:hypothetical protein
MKDKWKSTLFNNTELLDCDEFSIIGLVTI